MSHPLSNTASASTTPPKEGVWRLVECRDDGSQGRTHTIASAGFVVGRSTDVNMTIPCVSVSKQHAEIVYAEGRPVVRDLGSTNGTYVNGRLIKEAPLTDNDVLQFANCVFRICRPATVDVGATAEGDMSPFAEALLQFEELMNGNGVVPNFQPIVHLPNGEVKGYELLARSRLKELANPFAMFSTAARLGQECALSELMRREGVRDALKLNDCHNLFVNTHPKEVIQDRFLNSLSAMRELSPTLPITVEIHEAAITNLDDMRRFRDILTEHNMELAYDDFGAGQARIDELSEIPPEYLKFDIKLIREIDKAPATRQSMVQTLVRMALELGICPLAEGVETAEEAETCTQLGFELAQGFYFGRPRPA